LVRLEIEKPTRCLICTRPQVLAARQSGPMSAFGAGRDSSADRPNLSSPRLITDGHRAGGGDPREAPQPGTHVEFGAARLVSDSVVRMSASGDWPEKLAAARA